MFKGFKITEFIFNASFMRNSRLWYKRERGKSHKVHYRYHILGSTVTQLDFDIDSTMIMNAPKVSGKGIKMKISKLWALFFKF